MVKYTIAASVTLLQLAMFTRTLVALPIEYPEELESRAISNPNDQQLVERDDMELEARDWKTAGIVTVGLLGTVAAAHAYRQHKKNKKAQQDPQASSSKDSTQTDQAIPGQKTIEPPPSGSERRDLSELDARDWEDIAKRYNDVLDRRDGALKVQGTGLPSNGRRDLSDLYERDWDEYEKRSFDEFEERDWDDYELEARGLDFDELDELD
ncbi:hypothetical protein APHAL10511_007848 [Amanita phalloides]|nr:hypothetical protein APHAL10511_007848 [Amanita phalloides]